MGTAHSATARTQRGGKRARINRLRQTHADIDELENQIHALKILLYRTQVEGIMQRDKREEEVHDINISTYRKRTDLIKKGKEASSSIPFQEYLHIARNAGQKKGKTKKVKDTNRQTSNADTPSKRTEKCSSDNNDKATDRDPPNDQIAKPSRFSTALMLPSFGSLPLANTLCSYLEAYLLKRLHMAMLQEHQQTIQRESWSSNIGHLCLEMEPLKKESAVINSKLRRRVDARKDRIEGMKKVYEHHLRLQELLIYRYEQAPWNVVEALQDNDLLEEHFDESFHQA